MPLGGLLGRALNSLDASLGSSLVQTRMTREVAVAHAVWFRHEAHSMSASTGTLVSRAAVHTKQLGQLRSVRHLPTEPPPHKEQPRQKIEPDVDPIRNRALVALNGREPAADVTGLETVNHKTPAKWGSKKLVQPRQHRLVMKSRPFDNGHKRAQGSIRDCENDPRLVRHSAERYANTTFGMTPSS